MHRVEYGYGLSVDWSDKEMARIKEAKISVMARRMVGIDNKGHAIQQWMKNPENAEAFDLALEEAKKWN